MLSVILSNFNNSSFLEERLESILRQLGNGEIVIVDDGSTDDSFSIIQKFAHLDPRVKIIQNPKNLGVNASVNKALKIAKGKYVTFLAADDTILPEFIEKTLGVLLANPEIGICCSNCGMSFAESSKVISTRLHNTSEICLFFPKEVAKIIKEERFFVPGHTAIMKKELVDALGGYDEKLNFHSDWFLVHAIALLHGVAYIPETLSIWRQHTNSYSKIQSGDKKIRKQVAFRLFQILSTKTKLRKQFKKSNILQKYSKDCGWKLAFFPCYFDLLFAKSKFKRS